MSCKTKIPLSHEIGNLLRYSAEFRDPSIDVSVDPDASLIDPSTVAVRVHPPAGSPPSFDLVYPADVIRDSVGRYHVDIDIAVAGLWTLRFYSTGTGQAATEDSFKVPAATVP